MIPGTQVGTSFLQIFPCRFEVSLESDRWMASADWSAIPRTVLYTATNSRSFLLIQDVRFAWRVVCEILATFCVVYVWCGLSHTSV